MIYLHFIIALGVLVFAAGKFTQSAERMGTYFKLPPFVIGIFIVGIGTSLPELISSILSVTNNASEIVPGNIMGANISNLLFITGMVAVINRKNIELSSSYIFIDLHYLIGAIFIFCITAFDGEITLLESVIGMVAYGFYSTYLIKSGNQDFSTNEEQPVKFPALPLVYLIAASYCIYLGASHTVSSLTQIASNLGVPSSIIALTVLSLGTTLPELAVNISAIREGKAEMAIGNVLGSCVFNTLIVSGVASVFGTITVPTELINFSLPIMVASAVLFYMVTQDKKISVWEGWLFLSIYVLFILKVVS